MTPEEYEADRREAGKRLDPETANVFVMYVPLFDPSRVYNDDPKPEYYDLVGSVTFASSPEVGKVCFEDLPDKTQKRLWERMKAGDFRDDFFPF